jgi:CO/xanthine dehydrogenase Mo-binding subunit
MTYSLKSRPIRIAPVIPDIELDPDEFILLPEKEESLATPAIIGKSIPRKDGKAKVLGRTKFGADHNIAGQLYGAILHSTEAHANIVKIDVSEAVAMPGVRAVLSGEDVDLRYGHMLVDQPIFAQKKVRYWGEPVAAVAADSLRIASAAVRKIKVEYEPLPIVDTIEKALKAETLVHEQWTDYSILGGCSPVEGTNIVDKFVLVHGDVDQGFQEADAVVENEIYCSMIQHVPIETHAAIAIADQENCHIISPAQSPFMIRNIIAHAFGYRLDRVRVTCSDIGGAFGCKVEAKLEPICVALSRATQRPVKVVFERNEEFAAALARAGVLFRIKTGATKEGKLTAQQIKIYWDTGAYATFGPRVNYNAGFASNGPYHIPNSFVDSYCLVSNKSLGTAYRGFGITEVAFAHETQMDALADKLDIDPLTFRLMNTLRDGLENVAGEVMQNVGVSECLERAANAIDWFDGPLEWTTAEGKHRGKGIACFIKLTGTPSTTSVLLRMNNDGTVTLLSGSREMGQGVETVLPQIASSVLGVDVERIIMSPVDTAFTPYDKTTTSSRSTFHGGLAVIEAAHDMVYQLKELMARHWNCSIDAITFENGIFECLSEPGIRLDINSPSFAKFMKEEPPIVALGRYGTKDIFIPPDPETHQSKRPTIMWMMGAQAVEVEVDPKTGRTTIIRVGAAHDVGKAINPRACKQQIEGGVLMGVGNALSEEMIYVDGVLVNGGMADYKIPTSMDADFETIVDLVECPHETGPYGVKGIGEPGMAPTAPAIVNAISRACGHRFTSIPVKPEHVLFRCKKG